MKTPHATPPPKKLTIENMEPRKENNSDDWRVDGGKMRAVEFEHTSKNGWK